MLVGKQVKLRPVEEPDLPLLVQWRNEPDIWSSFFNKFPLSFSAQHGWHQSLLADRQRLLLIIEALESHQAIGTIGFDQIDALNQAAEYGNVLIGREQFRHKGLGKEATLLLLSYGFERLNLNRVFLHVLERNVAAIQLYRQCGFQEEGRFRQAFFDQGRFNDVLVFGILRSEFRNQETSR